MEPLARYSSNQIIELSNALDAGQRELDLDGAAKMIQSGEWDREKLEMYLVVHPSSLNTTRYLFNRFSAYTHVIQVGERRFSVRLLSVRDKSTVNRTAIAYTFGITDV